MNPKANGQLQTEWGWLIEIYLFLGGIGGGAYTIAALNWFVGESAGASTRIGLWIGFPALAIGSLFLIGLILYVISFFVKGGEREMASDAVADTA